MEGGREGWEGWRWEEGGTRGNNSLPSESRSGSPARTGRPVSVGPLKRGAGARAAASHSATFSKQCAGANSRSRSSSGNV